jgi:hypothetical protein
MQVGTTVCNKCPRGSLPALRWRVKRLRWSNRTGHHIRIPTPDWCLPRQSQHLECCLKTHPIAPAHEGNCVPLEIAAAAPPAWGIGLGPDPKPIFTTTEWTGTSILATVGPGHTVQIATDEPAEIKG